MKSILAIVLMLMFFGCNKELTIQDKTEIAVKVYNEKNYDDYQPLDFGDFTKAVLFNDSSEYIYYIKHQFRCTEDGRKSTLLRYYLLNNDGKGNVIVHEDIDQSLFDALYKTPYKVMEANKYTF